MVSQAPITTDEAARILDSIGEGPQAVPEPNSIADQMRTEARQHAEHIWVDWHDLAQIVARHEPTIQRRWKKKTGKARRDILLSAWPDDMPPSHGPDLQAHLDKKRGLKSTRATTRGSYLWPMVNQEDLSRPIPFLLLLNSRGRAPPTVFALPDTLLFEIGYRTRGILVGSLEHHTMMFANWSKHEYGELVAFEDHTDVHACIKKWIKCGAAMPPGLGLLLLEFQDRLGKFLIKCCLSLLHEIEPQAILSGRYPVLCETPSVSEIGKDESTMAISKAEAPYQAPDASLALKRLKSLISARLAAAEDDAWALREDPGYFEEYFTELKRHRIESVPDSDGKSHPNLRPGQDQVFWSRVVTDHVSGSYWDLKLWKELVDIIDVLETLQSKHSTALMAKVFLPVPDEYMDQLLKLEYYTRQIVSGCLHNSRAAIPASPPLRYLFYRIDLQSVDTSYSATKARATSCENEAIAKLFALFDSLWNGPVTGEYPIRIDHVIDGIDRLVEADLKNYITHRCATLLGDLSIIAECVYRFYTHLPWSAQCFDFIHCKGPALVAEFNERMRSAQVPQVLLNCPILSSLANPSERKFYYPVGERRTQENVEALMQAEKNLDLFWRGVDQQLLANGFTPSSVSQRHVLQRTLKDTGEKYLPFSEVFWNHEHPAEVAVPREEAPPDLTFSDEEAPLETKAKNKKKKKKKNAQPQRNCNQESPASDLAAAPGIRDDGFVLSNHELPPTPPPSLDPSPVDAYPLPLPFHRKAWCDEEDEDYTPKDLLKNLPLPPSPPLPKPKPLRKRSWWEDDDEDYTAEDLLKDSPLPPSPPLPKERIWPSTESNTGPSPALPLLPLQPNTPLWKHTRYTIDELNTSSSRDSVLNSSNSLYPKDNENWAPLLSVAPPEIDEPRSRSATKALRLVIPSNEAPLPELVESTAQEVAQDKPKEPAKNKPKKCAEEISELVLKPKFEEDGRLVFKVDKKAYKVFFTLFHTPSPHEAPGDVLWKDFVHAMLAVGFRVEKLYGCIWHFSPDEKSGLEGDIQIHHPWIYPTKVEKISFAKVRIIGRRLSRAYGWHAGLFVLA